MSFPQPYMANPYMPQPQQQPRRLNFVAGEEGMRSFFVGPNEVVALFDTGSMTMWLKSANEAGVPSVITYDIAERQQEEPESQGDGTAARLDAMEQSINQIKEVLDAAISEVRPATAAKPRHASSPTGPEDGVR